MGQVANSSKVAYQLELQAEFLVLRAEAETLYCRLKSIQEQQRLESAEGGRSSSVATETVLDQSAEQSRQVSQLVGASA